MKKILLVAGFAAALVAMTADAPGFAQKGVHDAEFRTFYADFQKAVAANDKDKIADLIQFPVADWSVDTKGNVETIQIKDRAEFLRRYTVLFTSDMRLHTAKAEPVALEGGRYFASWKKSDVECSFEFAYTDGTGYRVTSYSIGPL